MVVAFTCTVTCDTISGFLRVLRFPPPIKLTATITEILLKVELNTIDQTKPLMFYYHGDVIIINGTQKTYGKLFMTTIVVPYFHFSG